MADTDEAACVFCRILRGELTPDAVAFRDAHSAVFPSSRQQPANRGHVLVVPARHLPHLYDVDAALAGPLMTTLARTARAVKAAFGADGVTVRQNNEPHGGQDVFHLHFHVIPRFAGDGFTSGPRPFPFGATEVPVDERVAMAHKLSEALRGEQAR
jgi:histidine triad (HIT) family protein